MTLDLKEWISSTKNDKLKTLYKLNENVLDFVNNENYISEQSDIFLKYEKLKNNIIEKTKLNKNNSYIFNGILEEINQENINIEALENNIITSNKETQRTINKININLEELINKDAQYFFINQENINIISNYDKLQEILNFFNKKWEKINASKINSKLFNEFILKPWIEIDFYSIQFISKENLQNNLSKILKINKDKYIKDYLILEACKKWIDKNTIRNIIKEENIDLNYKYFPNYIKIYLWEVDIISESNADEIIKNIDIIKDKSIDEQRKIIDFLSNNINNPKYETIIITLIKNSNYYADFRLLNIKSIPILKSLIEIDISNIRYIWNNEIKNYDIINCFLENLKNEKNKNIDNDDILWNINHINKNLENIEWTLHIFNYIKNNIPNKYEKVKSIISNKEYLTIFIELYNKSKNLTIKPEYKNIYNDIENIINDDLENIIKLKSETHDFNVRNQEITNKWYKILSENLDKKLKWLKPETKEEILKEIEKLNWKFDEKNTENIYNILKKSFQNYKTNPEFQKYFNIIHNEIKEFKITKIGEIWEKILLDWDSKYKILKNGKKVFDINKLKIDYLELIKSKTNIEQTKIKKEFIEENFNKLSLEDKLKINEILDELVQIENINNIQQNFKNYIEYIDIKEKNKDLKIDFQEYERNKEKLNSPENQYFIPNENNYFKNGSTYILEWKNGIKIEWLTEKEKKITLWNPKATENLINFHNFFKELNLESVWQYRKELFTTIWNININPNDDDSIKDEELRKFWNNILTFIKNVDNKENNLNKEKINLNNITSINKELRNFSWSHSLLSDKKTFNTSWEDRFTLIMKQQWIIWWMYFKINWFREFL